MNYAGIRIFQSPLVPDLVPKIKLAPDVPVSGRFRAEFDAWLLDTFGQKRVAYFVPAADSLFVSPRMMGILQGSEPK